MIRLKKFDERYRYLRLGGILGESTFGFDRYLNQRFYKSREWLDARNAIIVRDDACDLACPGRDIWDKIIIHHMNPITQIDLVERNPDLFNPEYLVCVSMMTHNAIHYGDVSLLSQLPKDRTPGDTKLW